MGAALGVAVDDFGQRLQIRGSRWEWVRSGMGGQPCSLAGTFHPILSGSHSRVQQQKGMILLALRLGGTTARHQRRG
jgi:hypothetical protein